MQMLILFYFIIFLLLLFCVCVYSAWNELIQTEGNSNIRIKAAYFLYSAYSRMTDKLQKHTITLAHTHTHNRKYQNLFRDRQWTVRSGAAPPVVAIVIATQWRKSRRLFCYYSKCQSASPKQYNINWIECKRETKTKTEKAKKKTNGQEWWLDIDSTKQRFIVINLLVAHQMISFVILWIKSAEALLLNYEYTRYCVIQKSCMWLAW